jgi:predicted phage terminase large subunit-like protein
MPSSRSGTVAAIKKMALKWPKAGRKLVEDKANGPAVISALCYVVSGLVAITPEGGKVARAQAVSPQVESCHICLQHPAIAPWVESFIDECSSFPNGKYDDQVDQMTQVLNSLRTAVAPPKKSVYRPPPPPSGERSWMR